MSTQLRPVTDKISQTRFSGGRERGVCVQITQTGQNDGGLGVGYIQLTKEDALKLAGELVLFATGKEVEDV